MKLRQTLPMIEAIERELRQHDNDRDRALRDSIDRIQFGVQNLMLEGGSNDQVSEYLTRSGATKKETAEIMKNWPSRQT